MVLGLISVVEAVEWIAENYVIREEIECTFLYIGIFKIENYDPKTTLKMSIKKQRVKRFQNTFLRIYARLSNNLNLNLDK